MTLLTSVPIPTPDEFLARALAAVGDVEAAAMSEADTRAFFLATCRVLQAVLERGVEEAASSHIFQATGPVKSTGRVRVTWEGLTLGGSVQFGTGQVLFTTPWGVRFTAETTLHVLGSAGFLSVNTQAEWAGPQGNVPAKFINRFALPDVVDATDYGITWAAGSQSDKDEVIAAINDGRITVVGTEDHEGGRTGTLDLTASDRGMPRADGESDPDLRRRHVTVPNAVAPTLILRAVNAALQAYGVEATIHYPWDYGFTWGRSYWSRSPWGPQWQFTLLVPTPQDGTAADALNMVRGMLARIQPGGYQGRAYEQVTT